MDFNYLFVNLHHNSKFIKMAIKKQFIKSKPVCKVSFTVENKDAQSVAVVGDFNNWNAEEGQLPKLKNGSFKATFEIPSGNSYEYRYFIDGTFENEAEADDQKWNDFAGAENSVLVL